MIKSWINIINISYDFSENLYIIHIYIYNFYSLSLGFTCLVITVSLGIIKDLHDHEQHGGGRPLRKLLISIYCIIFIACLVLAQNPRNYASPTSGEAYRDRRLTTNFEL